MASGGEIVVGRGGLAFDVATLHNVLDAFSTSVGKAAATWSKQPRAVGPTTSAAPSHSIPQQRPPSPQPQQQPQQQPESGSYAGKMSARQAHHSVPLPLGSLPSNAAPQFSRPNQAHKAPASQKAAQRHGHSPAAHPHHAAQQKNQPRGDPTAPQVDPRAAVRGGSQSPSHARISKVVRAVEQHEGNRESASHAFVSAPKPPSCKDHTVLRSHSKFSSSVIIKVHSATGTGVNAALVREGGTTDITNPHVVWATNTARDKAASIVIQLNEKSLRHSVDEDHAANVKHENFYGVVLCLATDQVPPTITHCDVYSSHHPCSGFLPIIEKRPVMSIAPLKRSGASSGGKEDYVFDEVHVAGHLAGPYMKIVLSAHRSGSDAISTGCAIRLALVAALKSNSSISTRTSQLRTEEKKEDLLEGLLSAENSAVEAAELPPPPPNPQPQARKLLDSKHPATMLRGHDNSMASHPQRSKQRDQVGGKQQLQHRHVNQSDPPTQTPRQTASAKKAPPVDRHHQRGPATQHHEVNEESEIEEEQPMAAGTTTLEAMRERHPVHEPSSLSEVIAARKPVDQATLRGLVQRADATEIRELTKRLRQQAEAQARESFSDEDNDADGNLQADTPTKQFATPAPVQVASQIPPLEPQHLENHPECVETLPAPQNHLGSPERFGKGRSPERTSAAPSHQTEAMSVATPVQERQGVDEKPSAAASKLLIARHARRRCLDSIAARRQAEALHSQLEELQTAAVGAEARRQEFRQCHQHRKPANQVERKQTPHAHEVRTVINSPLRPTFFEDTMRSAVTRALDRATVQVMSVHQQQANGAARFLQLPPSQAGSTIANASVDSRGTSSTARAIVEGIPVQVPVVQAHQLQGNGMAHHVQPSDREVPPASQMRRASVQSLPQSAKQPAVPELAALASLSVVAGESHEDFLHRGFRVLLGRPTTLLFCPCCAAPDIATILAMPYNVLMITNCVDESMGGLQQDLEGQLLSIVNTVFAEFSTNATLLSRGSSFASMSVGSASGVPKVLLVYCEPPEVALSRVRGFLCQNSDWIRLACWTDLHTSHFSALLPKVVAAAFPVETVGVGDEAGTGLQKVGSPPSLTIDPPRELIYYTDAADEHPLLGVMPVVASEPTSQASTAAALGSAGSNTPVGATKIIPTFCWKGLRIHGRISYELYTEDEGADPDSETRSDCLPDESSASLLRLFIAPHRSSIHVWQRPSGFPLRVVLVKDSMHEYVDWLDGIVAVSAEELLLRRHKVGTPVQVLSPAGSSLPQSASNVMLDVLRMSAGARWRIVGVTAPASTIPTPAPAVANRDGSYSTTAVSISQQHMQHGDADADEIMDTLLCWGYEYPRIVVLFYFDERLFEQVIGRFVLVPKFELAVA